MVYVVGGVGVFMFLQVAFGLIGSLSRTFRGA